MTHAVLAVMAGLLCGLAGLRHASAMKTEAARLRRLTEILPRLSLILAEQSVSIPAALRLAADGNAPPDRLLHRIADALEGNPLLSLSDAFGQECPICAEQETLLRLAARLGRGSAESRRQAVDQSAAAIVQMAQAAQARAAKDAKLWTTLGWTGGICLTLLLL